MQAIKSDGYEPIYFTDQWLLFYFTLSKYIFISLHENQWSVFTIFKDK